MRCNHCGQMLTEGSRFCSYCGTPSEQGQPILCPRCGAPIASNATYCSSCGTALYGGTLTPAIPGRPPYYPPVQQGGVNWGKFALGGLGGLFLGSLLGGFHGGGLGWGERNEGWGDGGDGGFGGDGGDGGDG